MAEEKSSSANSWLSLIGDWWDRYERNKHRGWQYPEMSPEMRKIWERADGYVDRAEKAMGGQTSAELLTPPAASIAAGYGNMKTNPLGMIHSAEDIPKGHVMYGGSNANFDWDSWLRKALSGGAGSTPPQTSERPPGPGGVREENPQSPIGGREPYDPTGGDPYNPANSNGNDPFSPENGWIDPPTNPTDWKALGGLIKKYGKEFILGAVSGPTAITGSNVINRLLKFLGLGGEGDDGAAGNDTEAALTMQQWFDQLSNTDKKNIMLRLNGVYQGADGQYYRAVATDGGAVGSHPMEGGGPNYKWEKVPTSMVFEIERELNPERFNTGQLGPDSMNRGTSPYSGAAPMGYYDYSWKGPNRRGGKL